MDTIYSFDYYTESWIEVSSQPSSSSLSSAATDDNALRWQRDYNFRRRRRLNPHNLRSPYDFHARPTSAAGSSQEEYEESESDSDRIMTSSNEGLDPPLSDGVSPPVPALSASEPTSPGDNDDDDDGNSTALGVLTTEPVFTPQPNAFSHPPQRTAAITHVQSTTQTRTSYFHNQRVPSSRPSPHSYPQHRNRSHTPYNVISPSHQADHDAALRASLSTLLSCAAAARGLPKRDPPSQPTTRPADRIEPSTLRMVPESVVLGEEAARPRPKERRLSTDSSTSAAARDKSKRKASTSRDRREKKKIRRGSIEDVGVSPTLLTWVVSAGVVVLFSAISFSAGYVVGREVGRVEGGLAGGGGGGGNGALCGKEVGKGLRKLRLGTPTVA
ncbi:MAG: hypothetical protein LQ338_005886 [Usnochroma carphineum]|nr:MAG: hypothetical protein LQ338_005886 [Usnochroma carphineum]